MSASTTHIFKTVKGHDLTLDVITPENFNKETGVALVHFHGGFLVLGEKSTLPPVWLINLCRKRGWAYISPAYRLIPEATALEVLDDAIDALQWVSKNISIRVVSAGSSAGGYLALATGTNPRCPPLLAIFPLYGMLDVASIRYVTPGTPLRGRTLDAAPIVKTIKELSTGNSQIISEYPFPANAPADPRFSMIAAMHQEALYLDVMTREKGLGAKVRAEGIEAIPEKYRPLFPASFGLRKDLPPVVLLHGKIDTLVGVEHSINVAAKLEKIGAKVQLEVYEQGEHGCDVHGVPSDIDVDEKKDGEPAVTEHLRKVAAFLDSAVA
ncbi:hypothetical protein B7463_g11860, partial [Scytalidium lignicola]